MPRYNILTTVHKVQAPSKIPLGVKVNPAHFGGNQKDDS